MNDTSRALLWTAITVAVIVTGLLIIAWGADIDRRIDIINERQRDVMIRLRAVEQEHQNRWMPGQ